MMGLEQRRGSFYYTRSRRVNGKVTREYVGSGQLALLAFEMEQADGLLDKYLRLKEQELWQQEREAALTLDQAVGAVCEDTGRLFHEAMVAAGYHQHARGEWRKKRKEKPNADTIIDTITNTNSDSQAAERHDAG